MRGKKMSKSKEFSSKVIDQLGYYVYIYSDPDTKIPFYIGKGKGNRCFNHLDQGGESEKVLKLQDLMNQGKVPTIEILVHNIDEVTALKVEAAAIDLIGIDNLTNIHKGYHTSTYGRIDVDDLNARYSQEILSLEDIKDDVIMIRINKAYHYGMSEFEVYDATRGCWKVSLDQANKVQYAFSVYDGMVLEVYKIVAWFPALETMHTVERPDDQREKVLGRFEFVGHIADEKIRKKYVGKMVSAFFPKGSQNPIKYVMTK